MDEETIELVEDYLDGKLVAFGQQWPELPFAQKDKIGCTVDYVSGRNRYIGYLISLGMYSFRGVKVGLDCANGSSWNIAKAVFDALGADTTVINAEPNGLNINLNAGSTHIEGLQKLVVEKGLDVGFAFDGDADRCLCVDEKGNVISGDHILYIYGRYMKERGKLVTNTVVTTIMSNFGLYKALDELGIDYAKTKVGDKYVYEYMQQSGARIGGEQSGHIIFSKYASTGDGILTSLKMMEVMLARKKPLSELAAPLHIYPQVLENVRVTDKATAQADPDVQAKVQEVAEKLGDTGRILVRESGTEPVLRVMVEAPEQEYLPAVRGRSGGGHPGQGPHRGLIPPQKKQKRRVPSQGTALFYGRQNAKKPSRVSPGRLFLSDAGENYSLLARYSSSWRCFSSKISLMPAASNSALNSSKVSSGFRVAPAQSGVILRNHVVAGGDLVGHAGAIPGEAKSGAQSQRARSLPMRNQAALFCGAAWFTGAFQPLYRKKQFVRGEHHGKALFPVEPLHQPQGFPLELRGKAAFPWRLQAGGEAVLPPHLVPGAPLLQQVVEQSDVAERKGNHTAASRSTKKRIWVMYSLSSPVVM